jgi:apolipoprotein N-acyltransferase
MFIVNFALPMLMLMSREAKRHSGILTTVGIVILVFHWVDVFMMVTPGSIGSHASISFLEIGMFLAFAGVFIYVVLNALTKAPLTPVNHPFLDESIHHEI